MVVQLLLQPHNKHHYLAEQIKIRVINPQQLVGFLDKQINQQVEGYLEVELNSSNNLQVKGHLCLEIKPHNKQVSNLPKRIYLGLRLNHKVLEE